MRILITGASGCGTTTLGRAVADSIEAAFLDADDLYWLATDPPFRLKRDLAERRSLLHERLAEANRIVVAGSIQGWDVGVEDSFSLIVLMSAPAEVRVPRYGPESWSALA
jgi:cytidylate kinase